MKLTAKSFAGMVDATAIGANLSFSSHRDLVEYSKKYEFAQIFGFASYYLPVGKHERLRNRCWRRSRIISRRRHGID